MQKCVVLTMEEYTSLCVLLHDAAIDLKIADKDSPSYRVRHAEGKVVEALEILKGDDSDE